MTPENELRVEHTKAALAQAYEAICSGDMQTAKARIDEAYIISKSIDIKIKLVSKSVRG